MSTLAPGIIPTDSLSLAQNPSIAAELKVYITKQLPFSLGSIKLSGLAGAITPEFTSDTGGATQLANFVGGRCLSLIATSPLTTDGNGPLEVAVDVVLADGATDTLTAIFEPSSWVDSKDDCLPQFAAVDLETVDPANKVVAVTGVSSVTNGAPGTQIDICSWPDFDEDGGWCEIDCIEDASGPLPVPEAVAIACGFDPQKYSVKGRGEQQELSLTAKYFSGNDGLERFTGHAVTVMVEISKCGTLVMDRTLYGNHTIAPQADLSGDGNDVVTSTSAGAYAKAARFTAI